MNRTERLTRDVLLFGLIPTWVAAGVVDWWCHRRTRIEDNGGLPESLAHVAMLAQAGVPATLALFLEADAPLLALTHAATATHTATAYLDVGYAARRREISPTEQHAHSFLEVLPMAGAAFLTVLHPTQARELFRGKRRTWRLRPKRHPLSPGYIVGLLGTLAFGLGVPYAEEVLRCTRAALRRRREGAALRTPAPPAPELVVATLAPGAGIPPGTAPRAGDRPTAGGRVELPSHELD
ncbi:MAG TPA: hypothetical protein VFD38_03745 [Myxococcaceae bacterium]|nr:hypothetical protein [Myxococcaceae bacterium]